MVQVPLTLKSYLGESKLTSLTANLVDHVDLALISISLAIHLSNVINLSTKKHLLYAIYGAY